MSYKFFCTRLNDIKYSYLIEKNYKQIYLTHRRDPNRNDTLGPSEPGTRKGYFTFPRAPELEPHHQIQFWVIPWCFILQANSCRN